MKLFVKKLWSTHPDLFLYVELNDAEKQYNAWVGDGATIGKTFTEWLETEIDTQPRENQKCKCCGGRFK